MRSVLMVAVMTAAFFAYRPAASAAPCGSDYFAGLAERLTSLEARSPHDAPAAFARDRELETLLGAADAPVRLATARPCPALTHAIGLRDLARQRVLVLWGRVLALRAVDEPVYPAAYSRSCLEYDVRSWQVAFAAAWVESTRGTADFSAGEIGRALLADPRYGHVVGLALERARRLRVTALPRLGIDSGAWLAANEAARDRSAPAAGPSCGPAGSLWALSQDAAPAVEVGDQPLR